MDPFDLMGGAGYATDLNCHAKLALGWIKKEEATVIKLA
jgi:hypothetical protein